MPTMSILACYREEIMMAINAVVDQSSRGNADFSFLPKTLVTKCKHLIISYHELNGSSLLAVLWHPETHKFIKADPMLREEFKRATSSHSAKNANEGLVRIATLILSTEILALGLAGWATRYPEAYNKARALLVGYIADSRLGLTKRYLTNLRSAKSGSAEAAPPQPREDVQRSTVRRRSRR
jgi:hypothetical protein